MDIISALIQSTGMKAAHLDQGTFPKPWGIDFPQGVGPAFHLVIRGNCWLRFPTLAAPIQLETGDLAFVSNRISYQLLSDLTAAAKPAYETFANAYDGAPEELDAAAASLSPLCGNQTGRAGDFANAAATSRASLSADTVWRWT
mgnify:CR=1 FL=1